MTRPPSASLQFNAIALLTLAALIASIAVTLQWVDPLAFAPILLLVLPIGLFSAIWVAARASNRGALVTFTACLIVIDLGFGAFQPMVLGIKGIIYAACFLAGSFWLAGNAKTLSISQTIVLIYAAFGWASSTYSVSPWTSLYTGFALMALALLAVRLSSATDSEKVLLFSGCATALGAMSMLSVGFYLAFPHLAVATNVAGAGRVAALYGSPNAAGGFAGIGLVLNLSTLIWLNQRSKFSLWFNIISLVACSALLVLSGSRNSMIASLASIVVLSVLRWPRLTWPVFLIGSTLTLVLSTFDLWDSLRNSLLQLLSREGRGFDVQNLTGRVEIWTFVLDRWQKNPILGYGLGSARIVISEGYANFWGKSTGTAHNALLESLLDVGLVGTILLIAMIGALALTAIKRLRNDSLSPAIIIRAVPAMLTYVIVFGIAEKSFAGTPSTATGVLLMAAALILKNSNSRS